MAKNPPKNNARIGAVKNRTQVFNNKTSRYIKRNVQTGKFMDVMKKEDVKFKGVRKEK